MRFPPAGLPTLIGVACFSLSLSAQTDTDGAWGLPSEPASAFAGPVELRGYPGGIALEWHAAPDVDVLYYAVERVEGDARDVVATLSPHPGDGAIASYRFIDQGLYRAGLAFRVVARRADGSYAASELVDAATAAPRAPMPHATRG